MSTKKKYIIYIGGFRLPDGTASAQRAIANAKMIEELGYKIIFVGKGLEDNKTPEWFEVNGYQVYNIAFNNKDISLNTDFINSILKKYSVHDVHAIIAYNYPGIALNKLRKFCKAHNIIAISEATEWYAFELSKNIISSIFRKLQTEYRMRYVNKKIGNVICSSKYISNYYKKFNTILNPNVIDINDSKWNDNTCKCSGDIRTFIYAGSPGKNMKKDRVDFIIKAFSQIDEQKNPYLLNIIGINEQQYLSKFPTHRDILMQKKKNIIFHGRVTHNEVLQKLKNADFSIVFRLDTKVTRVGFATKISESISCGVPVISNDEYGEIENYLKNKEQAILFKGFKLEKLREAILQGLELDDEALEYMKVQCRQNNPFRYERFLGNTKEFLDCANNRMRG